MSKALNAMVFTLFCFLVLQGILLFNIRNSVDAAPVLLKAFELLEKSAYPNTPFLQPVIYAWCIAAAKGR